MARRRPPSKALPIFVALTLGLPALATGAEPGKYAGKLYSENSDAVKGSKVTFKVARGKVRRFRVVEGGISSCVSIIGGVQFTYYPLSFAVPSAPIDGNRIDRTYIVKDDGEKIATNVLQGRFTGGRAKGKLEQDGPDSCGAAYHWRAKRTG